MLPDEQRVILLPFLKGAIVRLGALIGATFVVVCQAGYFAICQFPLHPQNLAPIGLSFTFSVLHTHLVGWAPNDASNTSFTFGGNKDVQNDFPFLRSTFPEPQNQFGELPEEGRPETPNDEAARRQILENIGD